jgi:hypothetical protein
MGGICHALLWLHTLLIAFIANNYAQMMAAYVRSVFYLICCGFAYIL